ncbi:MAG: hypothetical protein M1825_003672 [Sarcosagium campestre]|nr:MAG: hypothetical protein M1825_003672 [Sarcosagium campestre]
MSGARHWEQDKEATVYIGNLDERVADSLVWELMLQAGRIVNVHLPKDRVTQTHQGYGFVEFISEEDAEYAARVMNQVRLYGKPIRVNKASADKQKTAEVGAELFIGNLDHMVDEKTLYDTFGRFGGLIARDDASLSKGYGFVSFSSFEASDDAIANMNGQYLMNKEISVQYAYKKDGKGDRHGDEAERMLAAQARKHNVQPTTQSLPAQLFGNTPPNSISTNPLEGVSGNQVNAAAILGPPGASPFHPGRTGGGSVGYSGAPPLQQQRTTLSQAQPLPAPPSGLPARPPPSIGGYNGPQPFQGISPSSAPLGFSPAPSQGRGMPPSFANPPPHMPTGLQGHGYGRIR